MARGDAGLTSADGDRPTRNDLRPGGGRAAALVPLVLVAVGIAWPFAAIARRGLAESTRLLTDPRLRGVLWFTTWQAALSTVLTLVVGLVPAVVLARYRVIGRTLVRSLVTVPFVLPTVVVATAFLAVLPTGLRRTVPGLLVAHAWVNLAVVVRAVGGRVAQIDPALEDAAVMLGASRPTAFAHVTLPQLRGALAGAASVVFLFCFTSFGLARLVGGPSHPTVEVEIWRRATQSFDIPAAAALAVGQLVTVGLALWLVGRWQRRSVVGRLHAGGRLRRAAGRGERVIVTCTVAATGAIVALPLAVLAWRSLRPGGGDGLGLAGWQALATGARGADAPLASVLVSARAAVLAAVIAVVAAGVATFAIVNAGRVGRIIESVVMLPLATSAVTVGLGLLITFNHPPIDFRGSWWLVPVSHALVALPVVVRITLPPARAVPDGLREAAALLGASPARTWWEIDWPILRRASASGAGFAAAVSLGEFGASSMLTRTGADTVPVAIGRLLARPSTLNLAAASALSSVLAAVTMLLVIAADRRRDDRGAWF